MGIQKDLKVDVYLLHAYTRYSLHQVGSRRLRLQITPQQGPSAIASRWTYTQREMLSRSWKMADMPIRQGKKQRKKKEKKERLPCLSGRSRKVYGGSVKILVMLIALFTVWRRGQEMANEGSEIFGVFLPSNTGH